jgi:molybdopterin molybdotransferase
VADGHPAGDHTPGSHPDPPTVQGREFFTALTVADALAGFQPARRTPVESVTVYTARGRIPATPVHSATALPGFARSTVDGYAVRAADTFGASEGLPGYLEVTGAVRMGTAPTVAVTAGSAVTMPTGGALPEGADAVVMVEHTQATMPGTIEVTRPVAVGENTVRADEDVAVGAELVPAGRPLRAQDLGVLAAAGVTEVAVHARPRVAVLSTGDEVVPPGRSAWNPARSATRRPPRSPGSSTKPVASPTAAGIVPDDAGALDAALRSALTDADVIVVSAGSSVGARDETAGVVAGLGPPGIFCHGLAVKPGKPTLLAESHGCPDHRTSRQPTVGAGGVPARWPAADPPGRWVERHPGGTHLVGEVDPPGRLGRRTSGRRAGAPR